MDKSELRKLQEHLKRTWKDPAPCPMCDHVDWRVQGEMYKLSHYKQDWDTGFIPGPIIPVIPIICNNCGNTVLINAVKAGIVSKGGGTLDV